jgi:hypothetical protein
MKRPVVELVKTFAFEAARICRPEGHKCLRMRDPRHGRRAGQIDRCRVAHRLGELGSIVRPIVDQLDHYVLNEVPAWRTRLENLAVWIWHQLAVFAGSYRVTVEETCASRCAIAKWTNRTDRTDRTMGPHRPALSLARSLRAALVRSVR